jgi:hypothetical protein
MGETTGSGGHVHRSSSPFPGLPSSRWYRCWAGVVGLFRRSKLSAL